LQPNTRPQADRSSNGVTVQNGSICGSNSHRQQQHMGSTSLSALLFPPSPRSTLQYAVSLELSQLFFRELSPSCSRCHLANIDPPFLLPFCPPFSRNIICRIQNIRLLCTTFALLLRSIWNHEISLVLLW
jgi:hypothetical protein